MPEQISRTALMERMNSRKALLEAVRQVRDDLDAVIAQVDEERMQQPASFGPWSFKDLIAHLTGWRLTTVARLEAGLRDEEPVFPWPEGLDERDGPDEINEYFYQINRDKPLDMIIEESNQTFDRVEHALTEIPEEDLFDPDRFPWLMGYTLGPGVISGMYLHYHEDHKPDIERWLGDAS